MTLSDQHVPAMLSCASARFLCFDTNGFLMRVFVLWGLVLAGACLVSPAAQAQATSLNAVAESGDTEIHLTWETPPSEPDITGYTVGWHPKGMASSLRSTTVPSTATKYTITGLTNLEEYTITLIVKKSSGDGPDIALSATPAPLPPAPAALMAEPRNMEISLTWEAPEDGGSELATYKLSWNPPSKGGVPAMTVLTTMTKHTITGLMNGVEYAISISAKNMYGGVGPPARVSATPVGPPSAPLNAMAKPRNKAIDLTWHQPASDGGSDLTSYKVSWKPLSVEGASSATVMASLTRHTIMGLTNGTTYTIKLSAGNAIGEGPSTELSATPPATVPSTPVFISAEAGPHDITVAWWVDDGGERVNAYTLAWAQTGGGPSSGMVTVVPGKEQRVGDVNKFGVNEYLPYDLASHEGVLYMVGSAHDALFTLNPKTGRAQRVGNAKAFGVLQGTPSGLTSHKGMLYMIGREGAVSEQGGDLQGQVLNVGGPFTVNTKTGIATYSIPRPTPLFGGSGLQTVHGLASHEGVLYTLNDTDPNVAPGGHTLFKFTEVNTGERVGNTPPGFGVNELTPTSLASHRGVLYMVGWSNDTLYTLDSETGGATEAVGPVGVDKPFGIAPHEGVLYMMDQVTDALYRVQTLHSGAWNIGGLTRGTEYEITVFAANSVGESGVASTTVVTLTVPSTPRNVVAKPGNMTIDLTWDEPESDGGAEVTLYRWLWELTSEGDVSSATGTVEVATTKHTLENLMNDREYTIKLSAENEVGEGPSTQVLATPVGPPTTPLSVMATGGDTMIDLIWAAPESDGGSDLTTYRVSWVPANLKSVNEVAGGVSAPTTSYTITDLTNGQEYIITLSAWNDLGEGPSTQVLATPVAPPTTPLNLMAEPKNTRGVNVIDLSWEAPESNGGSDLTSYRLSWDPPNLLGASTAFSTLPGAVTEIGNFATQGGLLAKETNYTITELARGQVYTIKLSAWNAIGESPSTQVSVTTLTVPSTPLNVMAEPKYKAIDLTWNKPELNGGSEVTLYRWLWEVTSEGDVSSATGTVEVSTTKHTLENLMNDREYTIKLSAENEVGEGPSTQVLATPTVTVPDAPQNVVAEPRNKAINLVWAEPESNGGSKLTSYRVAWTSPNSNRVSEVNPGSGLPPSTRSYTITGLTNDVEYTITLSAWNAIGESPSTQVSVTTLTVPSTPLNVMAEPTNMVISLTWDKPESNGGSDLTSYRLSWDPPNTEGVSTAFSTLPGAADEIGNLATQGGLLAKETNYRLTDLMHGQAYTIKLSAWNAIGESPSTQVSVTTVTLPSTPRNLMAVPGIGKIDLTWEPPAMDGGADLSSYLITWEPPTELVYLSGVGNLPYSVHRIRIDGNNAMNKYTLEGLENSQKYTILVSAVNAVQALGGLKLKDFGALGRGVGFNGRSPTARVVATPMAELPTTPRNVMAKPGNMKIGLTWDRPASNGGLALTTYKLSWTLSSEEGVPETTVLMAQSSDYTIIDLVNDQAYTITLSAWNDLGEGPSTKLTVTIPVGPPTRPLNVMAKPRNMAIDLTWDKPASDGGSDVTSYRLSWNPPNSKGVRKAAPQSGLSAEVTSYTITDLMHNRTYTITLLAENEVGEGPSTQVSATTPMGPPSTPRNVVAKPMNMAIGLTWEKPASDGGSALTTYRLSWELSSGGPIILARVSATTTQHTIIGLAQNQEYTITLLAENAINVGPSIKVLATPKGPPSTPLNVMAKPGDMKIGLTWDRPTEEENPDKVSGYQLLWVPTHEGLRGLPDSAGMVDLPVTTVHTITGLTNGQEYTITLSARNVIGVGPPAQVSSTPVGPPSAPMNVMAKPGSKAIDLTWDKPVSDGGSDLTTYKLSWKPSLAGGASSATTVSATMTKHTIMDLTNGTTYTITLSAGNVLGEGPSTELSATPMEPTVPSPPLNVMAKPRDKAIGLTWDRPALDGGSELTTYRVSWKLSSGGEIISTTVTASVFEYMITGLMNGQKYTITLFAGNAIGEGPSIELSATPVVPTVPSVPLNVMATPDDKMIDLKWAEPESDGGSALTTYKLSWEPPNSNDVSEVNPGSGLLPSAKSYTITDLTNGQEYIITLSAWNVIGEGTSTQVLATPVGPPTTPLNVMAKPRNTEIDLTWNEPTSDGGSALTTYKLSWEPPNSDTASEVNPGSGLPASVTNYTITGLANGVEYTITLLAENVIGEGTSTQVLATPVGPPTTPLNVMAKPRNTEIDLTWNEPTSDGGSALTTYKLSWEPPNSNNVSEVNPGSGLPASAANYTITGLANGVEYTITLLAENVIGEGTSTQVLATPVGPPTTPQNVVAKPRNTEIDLTWNEPTSDGGSALTTYKLSWEPPNSDTASEVNPGSGLPASVTNYTITGLMNGVEYTITLLAENAIGEGPSTELSATPATVPSTPSNVVAKPRDKVIGLTWEAPENGGSDLTTYKLSWKPSLAGGASSATVKAPLTRYRITGLTNGEEYTITLSAWNRLGEGPSTKASAIPTVTVPDAPQNVVAEPRNKAINLVWAEPANGGSDLTTYKLSWKPSLAGGASSATVKAPLTRYRITNLTNGEEYTITLSAWNTLGEGPSTRLLATPVEPTVPSVPLNVMATPGDKMIDLKWDEPADGGSILTLYQVSWEPPNLKGIRMSEVMPSRGENGLSVLATNYTITDLENGQDYTIKLLAMNRLGKGESIEISATPATVPSTPQNVVAESGDTVIYLTWEAPASDGESALTTYKLSWKPSSAGSASSATVSATTTQHTITGLRNYSLYKIMLLAENAIGVGPSTQVSATPAPLPAAPSNLEAKPGNMAISLTWDDPTVGKHGDFLEKTHRLLWVPTHEGLRGLPDSAGMVDLPVTPTVHTITGLMNGVEYAILVSAQNEHGGVGPPARVLATPGVVPTTPRDVMAVALDTAIGLTWEEAPALDGDPVLTAYKLSWQLADGSGSSSEVTVPAEPTAAVITGLTNDVRYEVSLLASNTVGEGPSIEVFSTPTAVFPELDIDIERFALGAVSTAGRVIVPGNLASGGAIINPSALLGEELPASGLRVCIVSEGESSGVADNCLMQEADTRVVPAFGSKLYGVSGTKWISQRIYVAPVIGFSHGTQRRSSDSGVVNLDLRLSSTAAETFKNTGGSGFEFDLNSMTHILTEAAEVLPVEFTSGASTSIKLTRINGASFGGGAIDFGSDIEGLISAKRLFALGNSEVELLEPKESSPPLIGGVVVDNMARHSTELITFNKRTTITFTAEYAVKIRRYSTETTSLATDRSLSSTATEVVIDIAGSAPTITFDGSTPRGIAGSGSNIFEIILSSGGESTGISLLGGVPTPLSNADGAEGVRLATRGSVVPGFYAYETNTADQVSNPRITANTLNLPPLPDGRTVDDAARDFGVFDFIVSDFAPGGVATVVLRLIKEAGQREAGWRYHKYQQGFDGGEWSPFVRMGRDKIFSAPAHAPAPCPSAHASREPDEGGDGSYTWHLAHDGIRNKDRCLLLEIEDGSVNDADGRVNAIISDPGTGAGKIFGIGGIGGGGGMDLWWLILLLGGMVSGTALTWRRSPFAGFLPRIDSGTHLFNGVR